MTGGEVGCDNEVELFEVFRLCMIVRKRMESEWNKGMITVSLTAIAIAIAVAAQVTSLKHILEVSNPCISLHIRIHLTQQLSDDLSNQDVGIDIDHHAGQS